MRINLIIEQLIIHVLLDTFEVWRFLLYLLKLSILQCIQLCVVIIIKNSLRQT